MTLQSVVASRPVDTASPALLNILGRLEAAGYAFVTPNRSTSALVARRVARAVPGDMRDVFGWNRPFGREDIASAYLDDLKTLGALSSRGDLVRSKIRVATLDGRLVCHSAPGRDPQAVFLGPDSYRFVRFLNHELDRTPDFERALDIGVGAGAGALTLSARQPDAVVIGADVNSRALDYVRANAAHSGLSVELLLADGVPGGAPFDLIIANPPFIAGRTDQTYRDGGGDIGTELSLLWARRAIARLGPGGRFMLYTGSPIIDGVDRVRGSLEQLADEADLELRYGEIDPDIFGGLLGAEAYQRVERIAAIGAVLSKRR